MSWADGVSKGTLLWVPTKDGRHSLGQVTRRTISMLEIHVLNSDKHFSLDLEKPDIPVLKANSQVEADMTSLRHLHLPGILHNLRERSLADEPYTFLGGNVLVAVNPLRAVGEPDILGKRSALGHPHPYAMAESGYQQLCFAAGRKLVEKDVVVDQSILVSGESGAGKTESSKMVLRHLVKRCVDSGDSAVSDLDVRLLQTNPILEAFGNAATKRNHNSSRFGKFMKLHFVRKKGSRKFVICGASVETYLLERSRITSHGDGERGYHVFYHLVSGAGRAHRSEFKLDQPFNYLTPKEKKDIGGKKGGGANKRNKSLRLSLRRLESQDKSHFGALCDAFEKVNVPKSSSDGLDQKTLFGILAAMLHLGNVEFINDTSTSEGNVAKPKDMEPLEVAARLLGVKPKKLLALFVEKKRKAMGEEIISKRDAINAKDALDAVVKTLYVRLFDWIVRMISSSLSKEPKSSSKSKQPHFIGVLDIFGFECFSINDFEQLLINYANEALQSSFHKQIFEAEADLFRQEGLLPDNDCKDALPIDNIKCMELLRGTGNKSNNVNLKLGILGIIDAEGKNVNSLDEKMNSALHRTFKGHTHFPNPHPKDIRSTFIIKHFAGEVKYTVGSFLEKNSDKVPPEVGELFSASSASLVVALFDELHSKSSQKDSIATARKTAKGLSDSVISKFKTQIDKLLRTLDKTRCCFIRCVKPNPLMVREDDDTWFDDEYVTHQLENLCIPQTTQVLRGGFPTRLPLEAVRENFLEALPADALKRWRGLQKRDPESFTKAFLYSLFLAFEVDPATYKIGQTRVFFKTGQLEKLSSALDASSSGQGLDEKIVERFRHYFAYYFWRKALVKQVSINKFSALLDLTRARNGAATVLQRIARRRLSEVKVKAELARQREEKRKKEEQKKKEEAKEARRREKEQRRKAEEAQKKKAPEAEALHLEQQRLEEAAAEKEEQARAAALERAEAKEYRSTLEKQEKAARKKEQEETKAAVKRCGGEEAYLKQKEREKGIRFNDDIHTEEFVPYLDDNFMEPPTHSSNSRQVDEDIRLSQAPDLASLARSIKVVSSTVKGLATTAAAEIRRSYVRPASVKSNVGKEPELGQNLYAENVKVALDCDPPYESSRLGKGDSSRGNRGRGKKPTQRASSRLACFLGVGTNRARHSAPAGGRGGGIRGSYNKPFRWKDCFVQLRGFTLQYFSGSVLDNTTQDLIGLDLLGTVELAGVREILRFERIDSHPKLAASSKEEALDPRCVVQLLHVKGESPVLRFQTVEECNRWTSALDTALTQWKEEVRAMRKFRKGKLNSERMSEYKDMLKAGEINKKEFQAALGQQVSTEAEYVQQHVAIYGEEAYDRRVMCSECRAINHLAGQDSSEVLECHSCKSQIRHDGSVVVQPVSLLQPSVEDPQTPTKAKQDGLQFPVSVVMSDSGTLTVHQGELLGRPRFFARTGERQYYFSFRCIFEDKKDKKNVRYWSIDFPFPSFRFLDTTLRRSLESKGVKVSLPDFPEGDYDVEDAKQVAQLRLHDLNQYMHDLMTLAGQDPIIFRQTVIRSFFNLKNNVQVAPLNLDELKQLERSFNHLQHTYTEKKKLTKQVYLLYKHVRDLFARIEASSDEEILFTSLDPSVVGLSLQEKGEVFRVAQDYLDILDAFEDEYSASIREMETAEFAHSKKK